jgi:hypothetical protein
MAALFCPVLVGLVLYVPAPASFQAVCCLLNLDSSMQGGPGIKDLGDMTLLG